MATKKRKGLHQRAAEWVKKTGWWPEGTVHDATCRARLIFTYKQAFKAGRRTAQRRESGGPQR